MSEKLISNNLDMSNVLSNDIELKNQVIKKTDINPKNERKRLISIYKKKFPNKKVQLKSGKLSKNFIDWNKDQVRRGLTNFISFLPKEGVIYNERKDKFVKKEDIRDNVRNYIEGDILKYRTMKEREQYKKKIKKSTKTKKEYIKNLRKELKKDIVLDSNPAGNYFDGKGLKGKYTTINTNLLNLSSDWERFKKLLNPNDQYLLRISNIKPVSQQQERTNPYDGNPVPVIPPPDYTYITLHPGNLNRLTDYFKDYEIIEKREKSDSFFFTFLKSKKKVEIVNLSNIVVGDKKLKLNIKPKPSGGFFPFTHNFDKVDLSRYGVYTKEQEEKVDGKYDINCICHTLKTAGIEITPILHIVKNRNIPITKLEEIANLLEIHIVLKSIKCQTNLRRYGDNKNKIVNIGLIADHFFLIEKTNYTSYCIKNYHDVKNEREFNRIYTKEKNKYKRKDRFITSYDIIKYLYENKEKCLKQLTYNQNIYKSNFHSKVKEFGSLEYQEKLNTKINKSKMLGIGHTLDIVYFDFETTTSRNDGVETEHKAYCVYTDKHRNGFFGEDCAKQLLDDLVNKYGTHKKSEMIDLTYKHKISLKLIAHNAGYDFRFLQKHLYKVETIEKSNGIMSCKALAYNRDLVLSIQITDSLKMINMPLKKFGKCFNLDVKKEILPYSLYTEENVEENYLDIDYCLSFVDKNDEDEYLENCNKWECIKDDKIDILKYAGEYCYMDCITLKKGYETFKRLVDEATGQDINEYLTLASMADDYLKQNGCYDDVYMVSGVPRHFIQQCVVGGRTMTANNEKHKKMNCKISDFDAVSLYPSAMNRMDGFLKGRPKVIKNFEPNNYDGYFIKIKITRIGKKYNFPCASVLSEDGIRNFTNDLVGKEIYMDKVGLEDLVNFQDVDYDFIMGYYYDEGRNTKIKDTMRHLFNQRLKFKKEKNPIQMVFKELMNSSYGKSFMKPIETEKKYVNKDYFGTFLHRYYNDIKVATELPDGRTIKVETIKSIDNHFNNVHCGVEILSMSKRIMYEVMTLAEDKNYNMYITDTDSIHIDSDKVPLLGNDFKEKYNRVLIGNDMGQFHTDFEMDGAEEEIFAVDSVFLGKKCYCDRLKSKDKDGKVIYDYHIRMKGVPVDSIIHKADEEFNGDVIKLYNHLYNDPNGLEFDLLAGGKVRFEFNKDMTINNKNNFKRRVKFK